MTRGPDAHQQRFAQLAWHFNCHIATMAHPSWLHHPQQAGDMVWSAHLLARGGVDRMHDWRLADAASRFWLLDAALLQDLLQALCGLQLRPQLARAVSKTRRDGLRAQCSPVMWEAANDASAPRLDAAAATASGGVPEAPRGAARALLGLLEPSRRAVTQRARLRLPRDWQHDDPAALPDTQRKDLADWIAHRWIPQRSAAWAWLF
jgi:hypothetical protein